MKIALKSFMVVGPESYEACAKMYVLCNLICRHKDAGSFFWGKKLIFYIHKRTGIHDSDVIFT